MTFRPIIIRYKGNESVNEFYDVVIDSIDKALTLITMDESAASNEDLERLRVEFSSRAAMLRNAQSRRFLSKNRR